jgi:hypothetical protein
MEEVNTKSIRSRVFNGDDKDWVGWSMQIESFGVINFFAAALEEGGEDDLPATETTVMPDTPEGELGTQARKRNQVAMAHLTLALSSLHVLGYVQRAKTNEYPKTGLAHLVMTALRHKYQRHDITALLEERKALSAIKMSKYEDPENLFKALNALDLRFSNHVLGGRRVNQMDLVSVVLKVAPSQYTSSLADEVRRGGTGLALSDLEDCMDGIFRITKIPKGYKKTDDDGADEFALGAFDGLCFNCDEPGHRANVCPNKKKGATNGKGKIKCSICDTVGHLDKDCFTKESNKSKRPRWFKAKMKKQAALDAEHAGAAIDGYSDSEFSLSALSVSDRSLLMQKDHWIFDSGATVNMTAHNDGMTNVRRPAGDEDVRMGNNQVETVTLIGDIPGTVCNKRGKALHRTIIRDVHYLEGSAYNLLSTTTMQEKGWVLHGDKTIMTLSKGKYIIKADCVITTPKGKIFAVRFRRDLVRHLEVDLLIPKSCMS